MVPPAPDRSASATLTAADDDVTSPSNGCYLYLLLECRRPAAGGARWALDPIDELRIGRGGERRSSRSEGGGGVLSIEVPDPRMSTRHARLARLAGGWAFEDLESKNGSRVRGIATRRATLRDGDVVEIGETMFLYAEETAPGSGALDSGDLAAPRSFAPGLETLSPTVAREYERLAAVAASDVPVMLLGETGTGKELAARALHQLSKRKGRFVAVNCGALPATLIEAELFGHRQGAFSGASESRPGLVRSADRGTLFLDEIGDLGLTSQAALLRVLQEKEVTAVGETAPTKVDVRIVAATHHDVARLCEEGRFRLDLLARLEGHVAHLPPLRERRADLGVLTAALLERVAPARSSQLTFHAQAGRAMTAYDWPRNVRELEQALGAAVALAGTGAVQLEHLPARLREARPTASAPVSTPAVRPAEVDSLSPEDAALRQRIEALLEEHRGSINAVARAMEKDRTQIRRWLVRFGIDADRWR